MAESPPIETARLRIVPFAERHLAEPYVAWLKDPQVVRYSDQRFRTHTLASCRTYWESFAGTPNYFWAVEGRDAALGHVGNLNAYVDPVHRVADVGILLGERKAWNQGYGTEAWVAACRWLLGPGGMRKVTAGTLSVNEGMLGIMRKSGMTEDGRRSRHCLFEGREVDLVHASLFAAAKVKPVESPPGQVASKRTVIRESQAE